MRTFHTRLKEYRQNMDALEKEDNYLNLWSYMRRRYPKVDLEEKTFIELVTLKNTMEGPRQLRQLDGEIATVRRH